jgi:hypothetical protein
VHELPHAPAEHLPEFFLGYTMWDYESDADLMWPGPRIGCPRRPARKPNIASSTIQTPKRCCTYWSATGGAAPRGLWGDLDFLRTVADEVNPRARHTQFADYHGHGWNFRAIYKRDREGNLLDADGNIVRPTIPRSSAAPATRNSPSPAPARARRSI